MWRKIFQFIGMVAALLSLVPLVAADYWWIRMFDFPHIQLASLTLIAIVLNFIKFDYKWRSDYFFQLVLIGCFIFQTYKFIDYTPIYPTEVQESSTGIDAKNTLKIYTANVLQKNKKGEKLFKEIKEMQPDLIVFTEVDTYWIQKIHEAIGSQYPHRVEQPQDNTYGMAVFSKLILENASVKFQVDKNIPSIHAEVVMKNDEKFQLYAVHPTPPMPQHNPTSTDRDRELMTTAIKSYNSDLPVIILGDFNDVAWSSSTTLTKTIGKLLDLRIGRGFYNTYHAQYPLMRWPLDHILISEHFRHTDSGTGVNFNSDHFPSWATLTYEPELAGDQLPMEPNEKHWKQAENQLKKEGLETFENIPKALQKLRKK
ncbi:MAG: endonuclease/exonuclease/phosphatase family protein [Nonlabens sp.]|nr:endonuclease/exonuclease/phosphatase family protein [Nonlabens sp.]